jgi:ATP phosphoribosyltransferase regulatory subunit
LLSGAGRELDLHIFKLVDQLSGRTLGVRADMTPQAARIDAHLLNRHGVTRLCYCGPVLHALPAGMSLTREPLQFGVEIYGHGGIEADLEMQDLALDCLNQIGLHEVMIDLGDARMLRGLLQDLPVRPAHVLQIAGALAAKDGEALDLLTVALPVEIQQALKQLISLYGSEEVIRIARAVLPQRPLLTAALDDLTCLAVHVRQAYPSATVGFDLADSGGNGYYSGPHFAVYVSGSCDAVLRGGRYDEVGSVFGRKRPAVGFSLDLKTLAALVSLKRLRTAIEAPWNEDASLRLMVRSLRQQGETVVCLLPGHKQENQEFHCDRELVFIAGHWSVRTREATGSTQF